MVRCFALFWCDVEGRGQWDLPGQVVELGDGSYLAYLRAAQMSAYGAMVQSIVLQAFPLGYAVRVHLLLFSLASPVCLSPSALRSPCLRAGWMC